MSAVQKTKCGATHVSMEGETQGSSNVLVIRVEESRPEMMSTLLPIDFLGAVLKPVGQSHITMSQVNRIVAAASLRSDRVVLRENQTHDFAKFDVIQEEMNVYRVQGILRRWVCFVLDKVVFRDHLDI